MKRCFGMLLLAFVVAVSADAFADKLPRPESPVAQDAVQTNSAVNCQPNNGDTPPRSDAPAANPRVVSPEGLAYLEGRRKSPPFGATNFDLNGLRAGMGARREPTIKDVKLVRLKIGEIPCEWVLAPGADPDVRLLYLHGGGWVSGSGGNYLPLAADISVAAKSTFALQDAATASSRQRHLAAIRPPPR
jgi:hypothetical protein